MSLFEEQTDKYLSCSEASRLMGVSRSTVQRYCDQGIFKPHKTLGGHRRVAAADVANWLKHNKSKKRFRTKKTVFRERKYTADFVADSLLMGKIDRLEPLLDQVLVGDQTFGWLFDFYLAPAMWVIGDRWSRQLLTYPEERRATTNLKGLLRIASQAISVPPGSPIFIGGALEGDQAELASLMLELLMQDAGFEAFHVGTNMPVQTMIDIAEQMHADLVWVSYCHVPCPHEAIRQNELMYNAFSDERRLAIGGNALNPDLVQKLHCDFYGRSMSDFCQYVDSLALRTADS